MKGNFKEGFVVINNTIPKLMSVYINVGGITLYPFIILKDTYHNDTTIRHEKIHIAQQKELFVIGFYVLYVWYWLVNRFKYSDASNVAYHNLPFEQEAYSNQDDLEYLKNRPAHEWKKYFITRDY